MKRIIAFIGLGIGIVVMVPVTQILSTPYPGAAEPAEPPSAQPGFPSGVIVAFGGTNIPAGWLLCDGRPLKREDYPALWKAIGIAWGDGTRWNPARTEGFPQGTGFNLPDLRSLFLRGVSGEEVRMYGSEPMDADKTNRIAINDGGNTGSKVGTLQRDALRSHHHDVAMARDMKPDGGLDVRHGNLGLHYTVFNHTLGFSTNGVYGNINPDRGTFYTGGAETRPSNAAVNYIIKH